MKKIVAILLTVLLITTMSITVLADNTDTVNPSQSQTNIPLKKLYKITGATNVDASAANEKATVFPHEVLTFDVTPATTNPTTQEITVAPLSTTDALEYDEETGTFKSSMAITLPNYTNVGEYVYTIEEVAPAIPSQAVSYSTDPITVTVLVYYNDTHTELVAELYLTQTTAAGGTQTSQITSPSGTVYKVDTFVNSYAVGHLDITKTVNGKLGSQEQEFDIHVTFTSTNPVTSDITYVDTSDSNKVYTIPCGDGWTTYTETIHVKHNETVHFYNIPDGVTYVIEEDAKHSEGTDGFDPNSAKDTDYTIAYDTNKSGTIAENSTLSTTVTNTKDANVATGIILDSAPYVLILVVAVVGFVAIVGKKRREV